MYFRCLPTSSWQAEFELNSVLNSQKIRHWVPLVISFSFPLETPFFSGRLLLYSFTFSATFHYIYHFLSPLRQNPVQLHWSSYWQFQIHRTTLKFTLRRKATYSFLLPQCRRPKYMKMFPLPLFFFFTKVWSLIPYYKGCFLDITIYSALQRNQPVTQQQKPEFLLCRQVPFITDPLRHVPNSGDRQLVSVKTGLRFIKVPSETGFTLLRSTRYTICSIIVQKNVKWLAG